MATVLPDVPPGTNPFTVYLAVVHKSFYGEPTSGFKVRLGLLFGMTGMIIIFAIVNWVLILREAKRNGRGSPWWLFRLADRQSGRYIVTNGKLALSLMSVITGAVMMGQIVDLWQVFVNHASQSRSSIIRTFAVLPLLLQGWLMPFAALQASLLASDHTSSSLMSARIANFLFAGVGTIIFLGVVASGVVNSQSSQATWNQAAKIMNSLRTAEANWTPEQNTLPVLLQIQPEFVELTKRISHNQTVQLACISSWIVIPVLVILVNIASLRLSRLMHRQVQFNIDQFLGPLGTETQLSRRSNNSNGNGRGSVSGAVALGMTQPEEKRESVRGGEKKKETKFGDMLLPVAHTKRGSAAGDSIKQKLRDGRMSISHLSRGDLTKLANRRASAPDRERIRQIQSLMKAEKDLVVTSYVVLVAICAILGVCIFFLVTIATADINSLGWPTMEATLTAAIWIYDVALNLVLISLLWFHWQARSVKVDGETSTTFFGQPTLTQGVDPTMSASSNNGRRGTVTIDFGGGIIGHPGGGFSSSGGGGGGSGSRGGGLGVTSTSISQASKEFENFSWGKRDGEEEVLTSPDDETAPSVRPPERRDSGRMSPRMV
ncbi:hypothetical protein JCM8547_008901 [Rhodosporidiobolus lusitaniae]